MPQPPTSIHNPICIDVPSTECVRVRLKTNPADVNSSLYDKYIIPLSSEHTHAEAFLEFSLSLKQLFRGQNVVSGPMMYRIVRDLGLVKGRYLRDFDSLARRMGNETVQNFRLVIHGLGELIFPKGAKRLMTQSILKKQTTESGSH